MSENAGTIPNRLFVPFLRIVIGLGGISVFYSAFHLELNSLDIDFLILTVITLVLGSRIIVPIPRFSSQISVSDTFVFLIFWLYGGEAALIVASTEAALSSMRFSRKWRTVFFNWGSSALSVFLTTNLLTFFFGKVAALPTQNLSARFVAAMCTMALAHYASNSGIVAIGAALKTNQPFWTTWRKHYLWTSITYFAGASAAGLIATLIHQVGFYAFFITLPIIAIVFLTYRTYLKNIETSAAQADQAERHVKELSHYIAEQERIREQFSQMEKLSALGELASGVAHDFNNTLAGILGRAQLLQRTDDAEKIHRGLDIIIKTAEDGAKTVKRIQDFARQRRDHDFELVSIDQILADASEITRPRWKNWAEASNIHITLELNNHSNAHVMGDDSELREVLVNMLFNAIDAMPDGGTISLSSKVVGESVAITVADSGIGMYPEVRSRVFDPFFTTKGKAGLGLGLAVSFGIVRRHGGNIGVESQHGQGTKFSIALPIAGVSAETPSEAVINAEANNSNRATLAGSSALRLLVVDDEDFVRELLQEILEFEGCDVTLAENGDQALQLFQEGPYDAVFTDVGMPGMSGWELAQAIRQQSEMIPIAVITGWGEAVGSDEQEAAGVDWVIAKPFTADRITELVKEIQRQRGEVAEKALATAAA